MRLRTAYQIHATARFDLAKRGNPFPQLTKNNFIFLLFFQPLSTLLLPSDATVQVCCTSCITSSGTPALPGSGLFITS